MQGPLALCPGPAGAAWGEPQLQTFSSGPSRHWQSLLLPPGDTLGTGIPGARTPVLVTFFLLFKCLLRLCHSVFLILCLHINSACRYKVTQAELFALLCRLADELLFRQIAWIKKLPFFCELSIKDYTCLLSSTWQELILLSSLTVYSKQIFGDLADVTSKYSPSDDELHR